MTRGSFLPLLAVAALLAPGTLPAQWTVDLAAGRAVHDPVSARVGSTVASVGVSYDGGPARWLYLSAGAPLGDPGPAWGAGGAGGWVGVERGAFTAGMLLGAHLFGYGAADSAASGGGATLEVIPTVTWARGPVRAELSAGFVGNADAMGDSTRSRGVLDSGARLVLAPAPGVELSADGRYLRADGEDWPFAGASARVERGAWSAWGYAGRWLGRDSLDPSTAYGAGAGYRLDRKTRVQAGFRQEPTDPVYLNVPRRSWSLQVSRALGRVREGGRAAPPPLAPAVAGGVATFRLPAAEHAAAPSLVGDFTGWRPVAMTLSGGQWTAAVPLGRGVWHYAFRTASGDVVVPPGVPTVDDGFGGKSAVLLVP
ncbi:MAG TPA: hypothetical protein VF746_20715 [Longimicrobium sp.]